MRKTQQRHHGPSPMTDATTAGLSADVSHRRREHHLPRRHLDEPSG
ncbi:hypothetical protein OK016_19295 [Vibrio chagasii]|nr:hypothetical protein [Vibrio chagasii]